MHTLRYKQAATFWEEALPLGNGRIGAMLFGGCARERIQLNEETLWAGRPSRESGYTVKENLGALRQLLREGRYAEATAYSDCITGVHDSEAYQMAGDLLLDFDAGQGTPGNYLRQLDLSRAIASASYEIDDVRYERETLVSAPNHVLAMRLSADQPGAIGFNLSMDSQMRYNCHAAGYSLRLTGQCPCSNKGRGQDDIVWEQDGQGGICYVVKVRVLPKGGRCSARHGGLRVTQADEVLVLLAVKSGFVDWDQAPLEDTAAMERTCDGWLDAASAQGWESLKTSHCEEHSQRYKRMSLDLDARDDRPTDEILRTCADPAANAALVNLVFNYGRYLLISSSRPGTQPANLQGIWNDKIKPPWRSNYTVNINTEMNYWPAETCNLSDCASPLFSMIRQLAVSGRRPAQELYAARGWCLHHNTDLWRYSYTGGGKAQHAMWPMGGVWFCQHLWEHYAFTGDTSFLAEVLPVMKEAAAFLLDFLIEDEAGCLVTSPSTSPENQFYDPSSGEKASVCVGSAMDLTLIRGLFEAIIEASAILGEDDVCLSDIEAACEKLPLPSIGADGRLLEFGIEAEEPQPGHRHISHLYGVHPGALFTPERHPDLYEACRKSLEVRGDKSTGWAMGWRVNMWARFLDGNRALNVMGELLNCLDPDPANKKGQGGGLYPNLFDAHPPFQIDGNFGVAAGIAEMLVQSHRKDPESGQMLVDLLPALPTAWPSGTVRGIRARGGLELNFSWSGGQVQNLSITASCDITFRLRGKDGEQRLCLAAGETKQLP